MHNFNELIQYSTSFNLTSINKETKNLYRNLTTNANTSNIKMLQMIELQKVIISIGMFSMFDAILQDNLSCENGFKEAKKRLLVNQNLKLHDRFDDFICAINVLKHGKGRSYDTLLLKSEFLPFRIKLKGESFFDEEDVSEIETLIEVDDNFVLNCADLIDKVLKEISK